MGVFVYAILFIGNIWIPRSLDSELMVGVWQALSINLGLLTFCAVQHSCMARAGFKDWITKYAPRPAERSTYVMFSNIAMISIFAFWQPLEGTVWSIQSAVGQTMVYGLYVLGWLLLFISTSAICHFDLFGLRQVWLYFLGKPYTNYESRIPFLYSIVRNPLYVGWLMIFWSAPVMTCSHLLFAIGTTAYIPIAIQLEERDLVDAFGRQYVDYKRKVRMLVPG